MADSTIGISEPAVPDKRVDTESLIGAGGATVQRERIQLAGSALAEVVIPTNAAPGAGVYGLPTRPIALPLPTGAATLAGQTQPGVDIGDVTINNAAGASAVNVQDGGNSITVDGTVTTTPPADATTNVTKVAGTAIDVNSGLKSAGTIRVVLATDQPALTNKILVTPDSVALPANQSVNINQVGGAAITEGQKTMAASVPVTLASDQSALPALAEMRAATLHVTATAAVNTASTCTLPAAGAGLFHYITHVELVKLYAVVGTAAAAGVVITSTNLPGNPSWTTEQAAGALGTAPKVILYSPTTPLKSSVANTATTFVAVLQAQTIWRWNVSYFTGV